MKAPVIHVGFQKSGTTYLQKQVFERYDEYFIRWSTQRGVKPIQHFVLTDTHRFDPEHVRRDFEADYAGCPTAAVPVISHEDLNSYPVYGRYYAYEAAEKIHRVFPDAKIIIGIREQASIIRSMYGQYVRQGGIWPLEVFLGRGEPAAGFRPICDAQHFEYDRFAELYADRFGRENVLLLPIEELARDPLAYETKVAVFSGAHHSPQPGAPRENVGSKAYTLRVRRHVNPVAQMPPDWHGKPELIPRMTRLVWRLERLLDRAIPESLHQAEEARLRQCIADQLGTRFAESNSRLSDDWGLDLKSLGYAVT